MILLLKILYEGSRQAMHSLVSNKLRTFLSLVGITIGIFAIVAVRAAVDSLQDNVMSGISELGTDVIYVEKWPWTETTEDNYWKFMKRPAVSFDDYEVIREKSKFAQNLAFIISADSKNVSYRSSNVSGSFLLGTTYEYQEIQQLEIEKGRYFTPREDQEGLNKVIIGNTIAKELFPRAEPLGKEIKMRGKKFTVIGVLKKEGESMFNFLNFDEVVWIPLTTAKKFINIRDDRLDRSLVVKPYPDIELEELKSELTGILRSNRKLKPIEENNFALNEMTQISQSLDGFFDTLNIAGFIIGFFALVVGMFSVANIMFVSVKERTSQIGIKMAIGAKKEVILWEFLIEGIILCIIGGMMGLVFVYGVVFIVSSLSPFEMHLSIGNLLFGIGWSVLIGLVAAIIPAVQASRLDPVEAIRQ